MSNMLMITAKLKANGRMSVCGLLLLLVATQSFIAAVDSDACSEYGDVRLINGSSFTGLVEICISSRWQLITIDNTRDWVNKEAQVVCRQLGLEDTGVAVSYVTTSSDGVYNKTLLDHVRCNGYEQELNYCTPDFDPGYGVYAVGVCCLPDQEAKPTSVSVSTLSSTSLNVSWSAQENNCFNYQISCFSGSSGIVNTTTQPTTRSADITGAQPSTTYQCCVRATANTILGAKTCASGTTDRRSAYPRQPQTLTVIAIDSQQVLLHWKPHPDDVMFQLISSYDVMIRELGITETTTDTFLLIDSLRPYTMYTFEVKACDDNDYCGTSKYFETLTPPNVPSGKPQGLSDTALSSTSISLSWSPPPSDEQNGVIIGYDVRIVEVDTTMRETNFTKLQTSITVQDLSPFHNYNCSVAAQTSIGTGPFAQISLQTQESTPIAPSFSAVRQNATVIHIDVVPLTSLEERRGDILLYNAHWKIKSQDNQNCNDFSNPSITSSNQPSLTIENVDARLEYCVTVSAETATGRGDYSVVTAVKLYLNSPFKILFNFAAHESCEYFVQYLSDVDRDTVESTISDSLSERCKCTFSRENIADGQFMCVSDDPNSVVYEGRLISTDDTDSVELLFHLQEWLLTEPTVSLSGVDLQATENCRVYIKELGNTDYDTQCDWLPNKVKELQRRVLWIGGGAGGFLSLLLLLTVIVTATICLCKKKSQRKKTRDQLSPSKVNTYQCRGSQSNAPAHSIQLTEFDKTTDDQEADFYVPTSDEEEEEEEEEKRKKRYQERRFSGPGNLLPIPPRCPVVEENVESASKPITGGMVTFQVDMGVHKMLAELQDDTSEEENQESSEESSIEMSALPKAGNKMATSVTVDWSTHLFLQSMQTEDEEFPVPEEINNPSDSNNPYQNVNTNAQHRTSSSEKIYQPLLPRKQWEEENPYNVVSYD